MYPKCRPPSATSKLASRIRGSLLRAPWADEAAILAECGASLKHAGRIVHLSNHYIHPRGRQNLLRSIVAEEGRRKPHHQDEGVLRYSGCSTASKYSTRVWGKVCPKSRESYKGPRSKYSTRVIKFGARFGLAEGETQRLKR